MHRGHTGTSLGGVESSPAARKRQRRAAARQVKRWEAMAGPVTVEKLLRCNGCGARVRVELGNDNGGLCSCASCGQGLVVEVVD